MVCSLSATYAFKLYVAAHWHTVLTKVLAHTAYLYRHAGTTSLR